MVAQVARESVKVIPIESRVGSRESGVMIR
jgi:hypothetical protein